YNQAAKSFVLANDVHQVFYMKGMSSKPKISEQKKNHVSQSATLFFQVKKNHGSQEQIRPIRGLLSA
ncbi:hypothetical protein Q6247_25615, partial [Klebsiella pneumoniae]